jgi:hypothetical protein
MNFLIVSNIGGLFLSIIKLKKKRLYEYKNTKFTSSVSINIYECHVVRLHELNPSYEIKAKTEQDLALALPTE